MVTIEKAFSGFSVNDLDAAKTFYTDKLGLKVEKEGSGLRIHLPNNGTVFIYQKDNHQPASFTILNFLVNDIDEAVDELMENGITFERYEGIEADEKGISRGRATKQGPDIAWFTDPAGNILSVLRGD